MPTWSARRLHRAAKRYWMYPRPYLVAPDQIIHYDMVDGTAYDTRSGSFPSGHQPGLLAGALRWRSCCRVGPQILARTSQAAHHRVIMGVHYPLDIMGGRMMGQKIIKLRLEDPEYAALMFDAAAELRAVLTNDCGKPLNAINSVSLSAHSAGAGRLPPAWFTASTRSTRPGVAMVVPEAPRFCPSTSPPCSAVRCWR